MILQKFNEGEYTPSQLERLRHLEEFAHWWFWWRRGDKRPQSPHGGAGRVDEPTTAGTLDEALKAMQSGSGGGVGLLVSAGAPGLVGIDVDNVIHGDDVHPLGLEVLERFKGAYCEPSPSGAGFRVFCTGVLPQGIPKGSTAMGQRHHGADIKFEAYAAGGPGRYLRITGLPVEGTAGAVAPCPDGVVWLASEMIKARSAKAPSPDNAKCKGTANGITLEAVFEALAELRPARSAESVLAAIKETAQRKPRGKQADVLHGRLAAFGGDHSTAVFYLCCEAIREGAAHPDDVIGVWGSTEVLKHDKQRKFRNRPEWVTDTIGRAAREVLADFQSKGDKTTAGPAVELPAELVDALAGSGDKVTRTKSGRLEPIAGNVVTLFRNDPRMSGLLAFNELAQRAERVGSWVIFDRCGCGKVGPVSDDDATRLAMWLAVEYGMKMDHKELMRGIEAAALDARFDPLASRLLELGAAWDGVERVNSWLVDYAKIDTTGCAAYVEAAGRCFLVGAVARALQPGCQLDTVLSVEGAGGAGKSSMFKVLADSVAPNLFADGVHDVSNTASLIEGTGGRWIIELAELAGIRRAADVEALKASITRREDTHRRPYDVMSRTIPRRFVMVATTNRTEGYLADPSGALARRFHPVRTLATETDPIDRGALARVAGHLWGEALRMYQAGARWHIDESEGAAFQQWAAGRELRREDGAFHSELFDYLQKWVSDDPAGGRPLRVIAEGVGDTKTAESGGKGAAAMALAETLTALGMEKRKSGTSKWYFSSTTASKFATLHEKAKREQAGTNQRMGLKVI